MNVFKRELKANLKSLLIWGGVVIVFIFIGITKFSAYEGNPEMLAVLDTMPSALSTAFQFNAFNLTTITGFLWRDVHLLCPNSHDCGCDVG